MADQEQLGILKQGAAAWNAWREAHSTIQPDLYNADLAEADLSGAFLGRANLYVAKLCGANLTGADLTGADIFEADLRETNLVWAYLTDANLKRANLGKANLTWAQLVRANLFQADLGGANLTRANLDRADLGLANLCGANLTEGYFFEANFRGANLSRADLTKARLSGANLSETNLTKANLTGANLSRANLVETDLTGADLTGCHIYGISAWGLKLTQDTKQRDLVIATEGEPNVTVDNIEVAQFVYLLLHNEKIRDVIDTITSKAVLILGRFTEERKKVLDTLRDELRKRDYLPILFDFEKPRRRNTDETITLLARMVRFVIADTSDAKSVLHELRAIVPEIPSVPVQPLISATQEEPGMFDFYRNMRNFLEVYRYDTLEQLVADLGDRVIRPAEAKVEELLPG